MTTTVAASPPRPLTRSLSASAVVVMYGVIHATIDAGTVTTLYRAAKTSGLPTTVGLVILYNLLAFALQAVLGPIVDWLRAPRAAGIVGSILAILAMVSIGHAPAIAVVIVAGISNALFHLGGGAISLAASPTRSAPSGVFVGPGALGLALGIYLGTHAAISTTPLLVALLVGLAVQALVTVPASAEPALKQSTSAGTPSVARITALLALMLLLGTVFVRAAVGGTASHALPRSVGLLFGLGFAGFLGKILGGFVADRVGWIRASVGALWLSVPLLIVGQHEAWAVALGFVVFQATMPVTLTASSILLPGRPATAFGFCALALVAGMGLTWSPLCLKMLHNNIVVGTMILVSSIGVGTALALLGLWGTPARGHGTSHDSR